MTVADQVGEALRDAIRRSIWSDLLPSESDLARRFHVGRHSVRAALARLSREGLLHIEQGRSTRIRSGHNSSRQSPPTVCAIVPRTQDALDISGRNILLEIRAGVTDHGIVWEEVCDARLDVRRPQNLLHRLIGRRTNTCWLLLTANPAMQGWFARTKTPAVVVGSCQPGIDLPSVDLDHRATGWHAAGQFRVRGHRHAVIVLPRPPMPGGLASRNGFKAYAEQSGNMKVSEILVSWEQSSFTNRLDYLFSANEPPTGIFCLLARHTLAVLYYLQHRGLKVPHDVSLISLDSLLIAQGIPELSRYEFSVKKEAHCVVRLSRAILSGHRIAPQATRIMPTFVKGATLTTCRE